MSPQEMADNPRKLVEEVLSPKMTKAIWSYGYDKALPVSVQDFELSAVLPAVFYMFRFGLRRGPGKFLDSYGIKNNAPGRGRGKATVNCVAETLSKTDGFREFDSETERAILGDFLLCYCLGNIKHLPGRDEQIQRVAPAHYMASWIDLPDKVTNLRFVPEMIVAMLADQKGEFVVQEENRKTWFPVGRQYDENILLRAFSQGVTRHGDFLSDLSSDRFDENDLTVGLDQILMIRLAQQLKNAPDLMRGRENGAISNQRPISEVAACNFSEDIRRFLRGYAHLVPRHTLVETLESCISLGLTTILTSTVDLLFDWSATGTVLSQEDQHPAPLFVDCSNGVDRRLRTRAEQSMDDFMRRMERFPVLLMTLRLLDYQASSNRVIKQSQIPTRPYATEWINLLGELLHGRHTQSQRITGSMEDMAERLAEELTADHLAGDYGDIAEVIDDATNQENPIWRLADGLILLMGRAPYNKLMSLLDSSLLTGRPNGLATKRTTSRSIGGSSTRRRRDVRSIVFTDAVLEYLVHLHLLRKGNKPGIQALPFREFLRTLRERYGFYVDTAPPGITISNEALQRNRAILERRLRDLGLLVGVNDAEAMKRLRPRFAINGIG